MEENTQMLKIKMNGVIRRTSMPQASLTSQAALAELEAAVRKLFNVPPGVFFQLAYADSDGDRVALTSAQDVSDAIHVQKLNPLHLEGTLASAQDQDEQPVEPLETDTPAQATGGGATEEQAEEPEEVEGIVGEDGKKERALEEVKKAAREQLQTALQDADLPARWHAAAAPALPRDIVAAQFAECVAAALGDALDATLEALAADDGAEEDGAATWRSGSPPWGRPWGPGRGGCPWRRHGPWHGPPHHHEPPRPPFAYPGPPPHHPRMFGPPGKPWEEGSCKCRPGGRAPHGPPHGGPHHHGPHHHHHGPPHGRPHGPRHCHGGPPGHGGEHEHHGPPHHRHGGKLEHHGPPHHRHDDGHEHHGPPHRRHPHQYGPPHCHGGGPPGRDSEHEHHGPPHHRHGGPPHHRHPHQHGPPHHPPHGPPRWLRHLMGHGGGPPPLAAAHGGHMPPWLRHGPLEENSASDGEENECCQVAAPEWGPPAWARPPHSKGPDSKGCGRCHAPPEHWGRPRSGPPEHATCPPPKERKQAAEEKGVATEEVPSKAAKAAEDEGDDWAEAWPVPEAGRCFERSQPPLTRYLAWALEHLDQEALRGERTSAVDPVQAEVSAGPAAEPAQE